jgi:hypothetical protein
MQMPDESTVGENALARFSRGPFDKFKEKREFSPVDGVVEEILGRLGCLRRNQLVVDVGNKTIPNSIKLLRDHDMRVLNVSSYGRGESPEDLRNLTVKLNLSDEPIDTFITSFGIATDFPLLCIDSHTVETQFRPYVVVATVNPSTHPDSEYTGGFKSANSFWAAKGYIPVAMADTYVVYIRENLLTACEVRGVVLRNPTMIFDWKAFK